ncbi:hypothetical protein P9J64_05815 [Deltaproteobacteria bacterium IMCC39524]|nr:hypothetical protein [Deltaproteobacteria bacterium IMCC39524]
MSFANKTWQDKIHFILAALFILAFAITLFFQASKPIYDPDFWWHLKTGELIVDKGGLLETDPFSFHDNSEHSFREKNALQGYWLWQVSVSTLYEILGLNGILLHNVLISFAIVSLLVWQFYRQRINICLAAPLLLSGFLLTRYFPLERPQVFSFFFAIFLVGMLLSVRRGGRLGFALPIIMCIWANVHGGFVFGSLILLCFSAGVVVEYRQNPVKMKSLLAWIAAGLAATLVTPNVGGIYLELFRFHGSDLMNLVPEYQSTWVSFVKGRQIYSLLWVLIALYFTTVLILRKIYWPELLIAIFLAYISVRYTRNVPFFALAMLPAIGSSCSAVLQRWKPHGSQLVGFISTILAISVTLWLATSYWKIWQPGEKMRMFYPVEAADFLATSGLDGKVFNDYALGGYLLWRLSPEFRFFIDGRAINPDVFEEYHRIYKASTNAISGQSDYLTLINSYKIDYVLQPSYDPYTGNVQPLMTRLLERPEWVPIYLDRKVFILAKLDDRNKSILERHQIEKDEFKNRLLLIYNQLQQANPRQIRFRVARAGMLIYMGYYDEARKEVDTIATIAPGNSSLPSLRQGLQILSWRRSRSLN